MTNAELIVHLSKLPPDKPVRVFWDGGDRNVLEGIVNAPDRVVIIGEWSVYRDGTYRAFPEEQIVFSIDNPDM